MDRAQDLPASISWTAVFPQFAHVTVGFAGAVLVETVQRRLGLRCPAILPVAPKFVPARARVAVGVVIVTEVLSAEAAIGAVLLEHRDVRFDASLVNQPGQILGRGGSGCRRRDARATRRTAPASGPT